MSRRGPKVRGYRRPRRYPGPRASVSLGGERSPSPGGLRAALSAFTRPGPGCERRARLLGLGPRKYHRRRFVHSRRGDFDGDAEPSELCPRQLGARHYFVA